LVPADAAAMAIAKVMVAPVGRAAIREAALVVVNWLRRGGRELWNRR